MSLELAKEIWLKQGRKRCPVGQPVSHWTAGFALPQPLVEYYQLVGPDELYCYDETNLRLYLPSLRRLENFQLGILESIPRKGSTETSLPREWGPERLAVAIHHTYPFIFQSETGHVTFNIPSANRFAGWQPVATLPSLGDMMVFFGLLEEAIPQVDWYDDELDEQSPDFVPHLIDSTSKHLDRSLVTSLINVMFG